VPLVEHVDAALDARQRLDALALETDQDAGGVLVGSTAHLGRLGRRGVDDLGGALLRGAHELTILEQERGLLLGSADDRAALLGGALGDPSRFLGDPARLPNLLRYRRAELVDELEDRGLVEDDVVRQRQLLAGGDE
jgi:hypothetical protein